MLAAGLSYREAGPADGPVALMLHGFPESSFMWTGVMPAVADAGWRAVAPDLAGFGDSPPDPPGTWERHVEGLESFRRERGIESCALVVLDRLLRRRRVARAGPGIADARGRRAGGRWARPRRLRRVAAGGQPHLRRRR